MSIPVVGVALDLAAAAAASGPAVDVNAQSATAHGTGTARGPLVGPRPRARASWLDVCLTPAACGAVAFAALDNGYEMPFRTCVFSRKNGLETDVFVTEERYCPGQELGFGAYGVVR